MTNIDLIKKSISESLLSGKGPSEIRKSTNNGLMILDLILNSEIDDQSKLRLYQMLSEIKKKLNSKIYDRIIFGNLWYLKDDKTVQEISKRLYGIIEDCKSLTFILKYKNFINDNNFFGSFYDNFFTKIQTFSRAVFSIVDDAELMSDLHLAELINLPLNICFDNCVIYLKSKDTKYKKDAIDYAKNYINIVKKLDLKNIKKISNTSHFLSNLEYAKKLHNDDELIKQYNHHFETQLKKCRDVKELAWAYIHTNNNIERKESIYSSFTNCFDPNIITGFNISEICRINILNKTEDIKNVDLNLQPIFDKINLEDVYKILFPKFVNEFKNIVITDNDIIKMQSFKDEDIRAKFHTILMESSLEHHIKSTMGAQKTKPHTVSEISDFEFDIKINGDIHRICIPVKSYVEFKNASFKSVPVDFWKQIIRPFLYYPNTAIVIFLTVMKVSLPFHNEMDMFTKNFNTPIILLQAEDLVKLFKCYNQLDAEYLED